MIVQFKDNSQEVLDALNEKIPVALEAIGQQAEGYAKLLCPVDTGRLRNSITHTQEGDDTELIGTPVEYAAYVEMGTSRHPTPQPFIRPAAEDHADEYKRIAESILKS